MTYQFEHPDFGTCEVTARTSGRFGFAVPKSYVISVRGKPERGKFTISFHDCTLHLVENNVPRDAVRLRQAIAQFIGSGLKDGSTQLDESLAPFAGEVLTEAGRFMSQTSYHSRRVVRQ